MRIILKQAETKSELQQILEIQNENHFQNVSDSIKSKEGFVTLLHSFELLETMNAKTGHVIALNDHQVVAYALVMLKEFQTQIPSLSPMFEVFEEIQYDNQNLGETNYYVMGQICVRKEYRRQGIFYLLYQKHKELFSDKFDFCLTEVSTTNLPSMKAHEKVGFKTIETHRDHLGEWNILLWDWN